MSFQSKSGGRGNLLFIACRHSLVHWLCYMNKRLPPSEVLVTQTLSEAWEGFLNQHINSIKLTPMVDFPLKSKPNFPDTPIVRLWLGRQLGHREERGWSWLWKQIRELKSVVAVKGRIRNHMDHVQENANSKEPDRDRKGVHGEGLCHLGQAALLHYATGTKNLQISVAFDNKSSFLALHIT